MTSAEDENDTTRRVRDNRGYDVGWAARCHCGWSGDLRNGLGEAGNDLLEHYKTTGTH